MTYHEAQELLSLNKEFKDILESDAEVRQYFIEAFASLQDQISELADLHPFRNEEIALHQRKILQCHDDITDDIHTFNRYNPHKKTFLESLQSSDSNIKSKRMFALGIWKTVIDEKKAEWMNAEREKKEQDFIKRMKSYLRTLVELQRFLAEFGDSHDLFAGSVNLRQALDMKNLGDKDYSQKVTAQNNAGIGNDTRSSTFIDLDTIQYYFQALQHSKDLRKIAEILGRVEEKKQYPNAIELHQKTSYTYTQILPTKRLKVEMCGVILGKDLENLLPQELALLDDADLEILFNLKYIQNRLFCFEKQSTDGMQSHEKNEGAMIVCVDTSGSMMGKPEYIAKALTLYLATKAIAQKRDCYLINFSTEIETMELSNHSGMQQLFSFLCTSFGGGTDVAPALKEGVQKMQHKQFKKSDLVVISDGGFGQISRELLNKMQQQRQNKNKFYLLDIHETADTKTIFDTHWVYSTQTQRVKTLHQR